MFRITIGSSLLLLCVLICGVQFADAQTAPSLTELSERLVKNNASFFEHGDFALEYAREESQDVLQSQYSGGYSKLNYTVANRGKDWFGSEAPISSSPTPGVSNGQQIEVLNDGLFLDWSEANRTAMVEATDMMALNIFHKCDYFQHCGLNVYRRIVEASGKDYKTISSGGQWQDYLGLPLLPDALSENQSKYRVQPTPELVDGDKCWVVEWPQMDKLWIDPAHGYAVRRRVYHWGEGKPRRLEITNRQLKEVATGIWLPYEQNVLKYANMPSESKDLWDKVTAKLTYKVRSFKYKDVANLFAVNLPSGTLVNDFKRNVTYTVPTSGAKPLELPIVEGMKFETHASPGSWTYILLGASVVLVIISITWVNYSRGSHA